ncbi:MAG: DeoR/GlpR transcriptional regulator [Spirochaetales bacterium]|nr:DeoR/GlpR transcriptional regulator [Spirochaetales bacterium]
MIAQQRQSKILELLKDEEFLSIKKLHEIFDISPMTLWRDLKFLEENGKISRLHGGVTLTNNLNSGENHFTEKSIVNKAQKRAIVKYAAQNLIEQDQIIILEGGTTVCEIVNFLKKEQMTILTNSLKIMDDACRLMPELTLISSGGILREISRTLVGPTAETFFKNYQADTLFLSGVGFDIEYGITDPHPLDIQVKQAMLKSCNKVIGLFDSSKFGKKSLMKVADVKCLDTLITDSGIDEETKKEIQRLGVKLIVVES